MQQIQKPRLQFLESIRGVAALVVVFYHMTLSYFPAMMVPLSPELAKQRAFFRFVAKSPLCVFYQGPFAVYIFFVLSGFVLSYGYFRSPRNESLSAGAARRYPRLMIPVLVAVLISYGLMRLNLYHNVQAGTLAGSTWLQTWYRFEPSLLANNSNGALRQAFYGAFFNLETSYDNVLWSMGIELQGSFVVFAFLALFGIARNRWLLYPLLGAIFWYFGNGSRYFYASFVIGIALCDLYVKLELPHRVPDLGRAGWIILIAGLCIAGYRGFGFGKFHGIANIGDWEPTLFTIGGTLVVAAPLLSEHLRRVMNIRPLAFLGRISFGLYLIHMQVLASLSSGIYAHLRTAAHWTHAASADVAMLACVAASLLAGWIMYYIADLPAIAISKWFAAAVFLPKPKRAESPTLPSNADAPPATPPLAVPRTV